MKVGDKIEWWDSIGKGELSCQDIGTVVDYRGYRIYVEWENEYSLNPIVYNFHNKFFDENFRPHTRVDDLIDLYYSTR